MLSVLSMSAWADSPVTGATLYSANCTGSGCHNTATPLTSNASKIYNARNARTWIQSNINSNNSGMGRLSGMTAQQVADVAAYLGNTPTTLTFPSTNVGSTSATQQVTVYASLKSGYSLSALSVSTSGDFARAGGTCATTVNTGLSCTILVNFTPTTSGTRTGTLSISHNNTLTPVVIALTGTGAGAAPPAPIAGLSPTSLTLASTAVGNTSAAQSVTVTNSGTAALNLSAITLSNTADYIISGGTCAAGGSVAVGASCTISVAFKPATTGTRTGTLSITHNASGSPGSVSLTGAATAAPAPVASQTASLAFGSQNVGSAGTPQTATLSNTGNAALVLGTLSISSGTEFTIISGGTCTNGASVAAGASCTVSLGFTPSAAGARSANLVITHNATGGQSTTSLSGTGVALTPVIGVSPTTLSFSQTINTTSVDQTVTVSNTGTAPLTINALTLGGAQASEYRISAGGTCAAGSSVAVSGSCTIKLAFVPTATGARNANLTIMHNATGSPSTVTLNGTGTAAPQPALSLNATTKTFTSQTVGTTSATQSVTVSNSGSAPLIFTGFTLTGTAASDFTQGGTCATITPLAAASTCTVTIAFAPTTTGARSATLTIASNASNGNAAVTLSGTATAAPAPVAGLAPASLAFGNQTNGTTSTARAITLTNSGTAALNISSIAASAPFAVSGTTCGASLAAAASCSVSVSFSPTALGAATGSVSVASNAAGSPHTAGLSGTGVVASPVLAWNPTTTTVSFGGLTVGDPATTQTATLLNQGPGVVTLSGFTLAGGQAADFSASGGTCAVNGTLTQGTSCTLTLAFNPGAAGARSATLQVTSTGTNPPTLTLTGTATAPAAPVATLSTSTLSFHAVSGAAASAQPLTLQNSGNAVMTVTGMQIASGSFTLDPASSNGCSTPPFDLLPGQSCAMSIGWASTTDGTESGAVEINTNASSTPAQVTIQATRAAVVTPTAATSSSSGGGCSIARGESLLDPTLWLLTMSAAGVLWYRRSRRS